MSHHKTKRPDYKEYVSFLENYKSGRKEDQSSICSSDSGISVQTSSVVSRNSSSTSLNSDASDAVKIPSYNSYLESYRNKRFSSVRMPSNNSQDASHNISTHHDTIKTSSHTSKNQHEHPQPEKAAPKAVKTEVFIEIVNPEKTVSQISKTFEIPDNANRPSLKRQNSLSNGIKNMVDTFESIQKTDEANTTMKRSNSVSRNITNKQKQFATVTLPRKMPEKPPVVQKVNLHTVAKPNATDDVDNIFLLKRNNSLNGSRSKKHFATIHKMLTETVAQQQDLNVVKAETERREPESSISRPPPLPPSLVSTAASGVVKVTRPNGTPPLPPPLPQAAVFSSASVTTSNNNAREVKVCIPVQSAVTPPGGNTTCQQKQISSPTATTSTSPSVPPPPPPPPPFPSMAQNIQTTRLSAGKAPSPTCKSATLPRQGVSDQVGQKAGLPRQGGSDQVGQKAAGLPRQGGSDQVGQRVGVKTTNGATLSEAAKAELIKKQAYSMLRGMYGAYHDQANGYVSTLPSYMVKKDNGLKDIISSIEAQGGLEKLNGRVNPKLEAE